jgi:hypothetical protein
MTAEQPKPMTYDDWWERAHEINALKDLCIVYRQEHDWANDEDTDATEDMLRTVIAIHADLMAKLGDPPPH